MPGAFDRKSGNFGRKFGCSGNPSWASREMSWSPRRVSDVPRGQKNRFAASFDRMIWHVGCSGSKYLGSFCWGGFHKWSVFAIWFVFDPKRGFPNRPKKGVPPKKDRAFPLKKDRATWVADTDFAARWSVSGRRTKPSRRGSAATYRRFDPVASCGSKMGTPWWFNFDPHPALGLPDGFQMALPGVAVGQN